MAYRLAAKLGWVNVDRMLEAISDDQWLEWLEFFRVEPWAFECALPGKGERSSELQARLAATYGDNR